MDIKHKFKEFSLSSFSVDNKVTVLVLTFIIFVTGLSAYLGMAREAFPEVVTPTIYITTPYPGNSPLDIEKLISRPIEKEINGIAGIDKITSSSVQGFSMIIVEFDFSITPEEALRKVKDKVDRAKSDKDFPKDLPADPDVFEQNISELMPIMNINLSGDFTLDQLKEYAEYLEDEIEDLSEITKVEIRGIQDKEVEIAVDKYKIESMKISFNDIAQAIQNENMTISGGDIISGGIRRNIRVIGEFTNYKDIGDIIVKRENQEVVYLKDIAKIQFKEKQKESYAREYTKPVVMLDVMKRSGENLINASEKINNIIEKAREERFPPSLNVTLTNDMSYNTKMQVSELENSIILGMLLVVGVLMFFLGLRNALFVGIAIPLSMLLSFIILNSLGVTLNTMVLFSLVMALGMLVDNGIVVVENIYRLMSEGFKPIEAAKQGVGEVAWPIIASTATTLAAFVPLAFWPGMMGEFMKYLPIT
ncbi:MAG: efflux RND transporter permease subunit, partial [Flavobacteriales bacterium]|nr:efflux RND transporter permease subunit [Flavobacteriales bacterium]